MRNKSIEYCLIKVLGNYYRNNDDKELEFEWEDGTKLKATITTLSETENGKELDDIDYEEYHACFLKITEIIKLPSETIEINFWRFGVHLKINCGIEISYHNAPKYIYQKNNIKIWEL